MLSSRDVIPWVPRSLPDHSSDPLPDDIKARFEPDMYANVDSTTQCTPNPTIINKPFWKYMIAKVGDAAGARQMLDLDFDMNGPVWCFAPSGMSITWLPDAHVVCIGGKHEEHYELDEFIYNDVIVVRSATAPAETGTDLRTAVIPPPKPDEITIYGYRKTVFPPTDFHIVMHVGESETEGHNGGFIYVIGGVGHRDRGCPHKDCTAVFRLDLESFRMERMYTTGELPPSHDVDLVKKRRGRFWWTGSL
ncbi:hypothetical protein B0H66DRAFT_638043 [Apodospora peruviana]|uniref:Uncharacterized protein n=1 Tax=Apodospora peruviana TaxID=516989 RepID=A0AAE0MC70_9PEZI|nr:hypothetical protein B0H66DRAFT_638043 [Apodospora peruviana]